MTLPPGAIHLRDFDITCGDEPKKAPQSPTIDTLSNVEDLRSTLISEFRWRSNPPVLAERVPVYADYSKWWREPTVISRIGSALADLFPTARASVVMGTESRGSLLGPLVALHLGVGFAEVRKGPERGSHDDRWLVRRARPDYRDRQLALAVRRSVLRDGDQVLFVDEWAATGSQANGCQQLVADAGAVWIGAAVIVDALENSATRRSLNLRSLLNERELARR